MESWSGMRVEALSGQGRGHTMATPDPRRRRAHWLIDLLHALEHDDLDGARVQFAGLVQANPGMSQQPLLHGIGSALQSSNLKMAQQLGQTLRDESLAVWNDLAHANSPGLHAPARVTPGTPPHTTSEAPPAASLPLPVRVHRASNGQHIVDFRA